MKTIALAISLAAIGCVKQEVTVRHTKAVDVAVDESTIAAGVYQRWDRPGELRLDVDFSAELGAAGPTAPPVQGGRLPLSEGAKPALVRGGERH